MKKICLPVLLLMLVTHMLSASDNEDSLAGRYAYTEFRGELPQGTCDVGKKFIIYSTQLDLNRDKTAIISFTEEHNRNPMDIFPSANTNCINIKGQWVVKNDTLDIVLKCGEEKYLIRDNNLIQLIRQQDGTYILTNENKAYRGEYKVFKKRTDIIIE